MRDCALSSPGVRSMVGTKHRPFGFHGLIGARFRKIDEVPTGDIGARRHCARPVSEIGCGQTAGKPVQMHPREGDEDLSEGRKSDPHASGRDKNRSKRISKANGGNRTKAGDVGKALRSVYDTTLREDVPRDFLDLLGKLS